MPWFNRKQTQPEEPLPEAPHSSAPSGSDILLRPIIARLTTEEERRIEQGRQALESEGVDVDDLAALGAAFDAALAQWLGASRRHREDLDAVVERYAIGIGEHLARHTDLSWAMVTDAFGTDLAVAGGRDEFVVVPSNLVAARWLNEEGGWIPGVVSHLVRIRASR